MPDKKPEIKIEREYIIPLREKCRAVPRYKKTPKAVKTIKEFIAKHMKIYDRDLNKVKIDKFLNEKLWERGIRNPVHKIKVKAVKEKDKDGNEFVRVELAELGEKLTKKKARLEKREEKAVQVGKRKKKIEGKAEEKEEDKNKDGIEDKIEEKEKAKTSVEETAKIEKAAAKAMKHQAKVDFKQPKHEIRMALQK